MTLSSISLLRSRLTSPNKIYSWPSRWLYIFSVILPWTSLASFAHSFAWSSQFPQKSILDRQSSWPAPMWESVSKQPVTSSPWMPLKWSLQFETRQRANKRPSQLHNPPGVLVLLRFGIWIWQSMKALSHLLNGQRAYSGSTFLSTMLGSLCTTLRLRKTMSLPSPWMQ